MLGGISRPCRYREAGTAPRSHEESWHPVTADFEVGDFVEWDVFRGKDRGVVSAITENRIYVRNRRRRTRGRGAGKVYDCEFWWARHEIGRLRLVRIGGTAP